MCPDKRRPEENKDKALLAYTAQVGRGPSLGALVVEVSI